MDRRSLNRKASRDIAFHATAVPLYAIPLDKADDPARFELTTDPVRLVLGWIIDDTGEVLPALAGGTPAGTTWNGPILYEETRARAEQTAKSIDKADRASIRDARLLALFDRWETIDRLASRGLLLPGGRPRRRPLRRRAPGVTGRPAHRSRTDPSIWSVLPYTAGVDQSP